MGKVVIDFNPRHDIETVLFQLFLEERTVSEMMVFIRDTQHLELERDDVVGIVRSHLNKLPGDISEEQKLTIGRLAKMLRPGLVKLEQPINPFLDDIVEVLNEQAMELSVKSSRGSIVRGQVVSAFLDTIKFLVELKREIEGVGAAVDFTPVITEYNYDICKIFVESIDEILIGEGNAELKKKLLANAMEKVEVLLKKFTEKYRDVSRNPSQN
jgi:hypothetical protein